LHRFRDLAVALSLANLCFVSAWYVLLNPVHYSYYHRQRDPGYSEFVALAVAILCLTIIFWLPLTLVRASKRPVWKKAARWALLLILVIPATAIFHQHEASDVLRNHKPLFAVLVLAALFSLWVIIRQTPLVTRIAYTGVLILSPLVVVNFSSALWLRLKHGPDARLFLDKAPVTNPQMRSGPHVLWILFDEMDQRATFEARPPTVELPELDRLRKEAIFAERAYPPAGFTLISVPALVTGRLLSGVTLINPSELRLNFSDGTAKGWGTEPTVFSQAREGGFSTAVIGWYHPYCRVLGSSLDFCRWEPAVFQGNPVRGQPTVTSSIKEWARSALYSIPFMFRILRDRREEKNRLNHIDDYTKLMQSARGIWARPNPNLTLLHFPVPHPPGIYDRQKHELTKDSASTYFDNLVLADRTLGELRHSLEAANMWEQSVILVSSDHWWRTAPTVNGRRDHRVPFILKLAGQHEGRVFSQDFNTVVTHDLLLAILQGQFSDADGALRWLSQQPSHGENEFTRELP